MKIYDTIPRRRSNAKRSEKQPPPNQQLPIAKREARWPLLINALATFTLSFAVLGVTYAQYRLELAKAAPRLDGFIVERSEPNDWPYREMTRSIERVTLKIDTRESFISDVSAFQDIILMMYEGEKDGIRHIRVCTVRIYNFYDRPDGHDELQIRPAAESYLREIVRKTSLRQDIEGDELHSSVFLWGVTAGSTEVVIFWKDTYGRDHAQSLRSRASNRLVAIQKGDPPFAEDRADHLIEGHIVDNLRFNVFYPAERLHPTCRAALQLIDGVVAPQDLLPSPRPSFRFPNPFD